MSPRPMTRYRRPTVLCALCQRPIAGEARMRGNAVYHPICEVRGRPTLPEERG